jgi:hypothetical protein
VGHSGAVIGIEGVKATTLNGAGGNWRRADKRHALPSADFCNKIGPLGDVRSAKGHIRFTSKGGHRVYEYTP